MEVIKVLLDNGAEVNKATDRVRESLEYAHALDMCVMCIFISTYHIFIFLFVYAKPCCII